MRKVISISLALVICIALMAVIYSHYSDYNIVKVAMVELTPDYMLNQIIRDFNKEETENIIYYYPSGVELPVEDLRAMEKAYLDACSFWDVDPVKNLGGKIRFAWLPGEKRYDTSRMQKAIGKKLQGRALAKDGIVYSIFSYTPHELNHVVAGQVQNTTTLLNEGFANYYNKVNWENNIHQRLVSAKKENKIIPLADILTHKDFRQQDSGIAYAEAALFTKYLIEIKDLQKYKSLYKQVSFSHEKDIVIKKIEDIYNQTFEEFSAEWEVYLSEIL